MRMKSVKLFLIIIIVVAFMIPIFRLCVSRSMYYYYYKRNPGTQPNSTWISKDGNVVIHMGENNVGTIYIKQEESTFEALFSLGLYQVAHVYDLDVKEKEGVSKEDLYEEWSCVMKGDNTFIVTVKKTTFFAEGEKITFHKQQ